MKTVVSQQIFRMISTTLYFVELYVDVFRLLLAYGRTERRTEFRRDSARIKKCQKTNQTWSNRKEGFMCHSTQHESFFTTI